MKVLAGVLLLGSLFLFMGCSKKCAYPEKAVDLGRKVMKKVLGLVLGRKKKIRDNSEESAPQKAEEKSAPEKAEEKKVCAEDIIEKERASIRAAFKPSREGKAISKGPIEKAKEAAEEFKGSRRSRKMKRKPSKKALKANNDTIKLT